MGTTPSRHDQIKFKITENAESAPARLATAEHGPKSLPVFVGRLPARLGRMTVPIKIFVLLDDQLVARHLEPSLPVSKHDCEAVRPVLVHPAVDDLGRDLGADEVDSIN